MSSTAAADSSSFLDNLKRIFDHYLGEESADKINTFEYLPEDKWREIKRHGLLSPFIPECYGGRPANQRELESVLRLAGHYGAAITLRTGIEGALVIQPLTHYGSPELVKKALPMILDSVGGGLAITEPGVSGAAIAKNMTSYYEVRDNGKIYINAHKYWQGNSQSSFLLVAAKERKNGVLQKYINLLFVPQEHITFTPLKSEGLHAVRYAVNQIEGELPAENLITLSETPQKNLREFQSLFIRSRLQFIGMTHGVIEKIQQVLSRHLNSSIEFVERELREISARESVSSVLFDYVCDHIAPDRPVSDKLMEANIVKTLGSDCTYQAATIAQKLMGARGYEARHPITQIVKDIRPFTIFEGPNDMLFAETFDQFAKLTSEEKSQGMVIDKAATLYERFLSDKRFVFRQGKDNLQTLSDSIYQFFTRHRLNEIDAVQKVFAGKILSRLFVLGRTSDEQTARFLLREMNKDILDFGY